MAAVTGDSGSTFFLVLGPSRLEAARSATAPGPPLRAAAPPRCAAAAQRPSMEALLAGAMLVVFDQCRRPPGRCHGLGTRHRRRSRWRLGAAAAASGGKGGEPAAPSMKEGNRLQRILAGADSQLRSFVRGLEKGVQEKDELDLPPGVRRAMREAGRDAEQISRWRSLHPERADDFKVADASTARRRSEFEDDGTVNALLVAFMRDVQIRAQALDREVPAGVRSKVVHVMRHGQGFHNMLENQAGMEGVVTPDSKAVKHTNADGYSSIDVPAFDSMFTEKMGPRSIVGLQITGRARDYAVSYSADFGSSWIVLTMVTAGDQQGACKVMFKSKVKCTHVRLIYAGSERKVSVQLLTAVGARPELLDPALTAQGRLEAASSHKDILANQVSPRLVVVSPVSRATETASIAFQHLLGAGGKPQDGVRFVAHEGLHERGGANTWDCRRPVAELKRAFPHVDYSLVKDEQDPFWSCERESQASIIRRLYDLLLWVRDCPEDEVALAAHCSVNFTLLNAVVDCSLDPHLATWFCTAEVRSMRLLWEEPHKEKAKFLDGPEHVRGLAAGACYLYPHLLQLKAREGTEDTVLLREDFAAYKASGHVAVICCGGAGHEPLMSGFVGEGLLTACVTGGLFAPPSSGAILRAIHAASGHAGCMLVVMNYPGVRLNNALAADRARALGISVEIVVVADDVGSLEDEPSEVVDESDARGCVGAVLTLKAAGAAAERGDCLAEVAGVARDVAVRVKTMSLALRWKGADWNLGIGVGIHGEAVASELPSLQHLPGASEGGAATAAVEMLLKRILKHADLPEDRRVLVVLNNMGGTSPLEMAVLCNAMHRFLASEGITVVAMAHGTLVTSLDMHGVSLSLLPLGRGMGEAAMLGLLRAPSEAACAWPGIVTCSQADRWVEVDLPAESKLMHSKTVSASSSSLGRLLRTAVTAACEVLMEGATVSALNSMDRDCGDADCGTTHRDASLVLLQSLGSMPDASVADALSFLSRQLEHGCRGAIGGIYVLGLEAVAGSLRECSGEPSIAQWAEAALAAARCIARAGGASVGDRTLLDALVPAADALQENAFQGAAEAFKAAVAAAKQGAKDTQRMVAKKGRARHCPRWKQSQNADPGAVGFAKWLEAVEKALRPQLS
mmetsp:Transcript_62076/g.202561  ORF Transcript_62076/g.202561 Transcript_62076/m.202561 type:complete len:1137 (+) Transcript_62076:58-3468(+)